MNTGAALAGTSALVLFGTLMAVNVFGMPAGVATLCSVFSFFFAALTFASLFTGSSDIRYMEDNERSKAQAKELDVEGKAANKVKGGYKEKIKEERNREGEADIGRYN